MPLKTLLIYLLLLEALPQLAAQSAASCEEIQFAACGDDQMADDGCYRVEIPFFFTYTGSSTPTPTNFNADEIEVAFNLEGNAIFDYDMIQNNMPASAPANVYVNQASSTSFTFHGECEFGPFTIDFTDCENPAILVYVIAEPGQTFQLLTEVAAYYKFPPFTQCTDGNDDCDENEIIGTDPIVTRETPDACSSDLSIQIQGLPTGPVSPHEEVQLFLVIKNNGGSSVTLSEADFRIRLTDVFNTLEGFGIGAAAAASGPDDPPIYLQDGDEYYFFLNAFDDGELAPSESVGLLTFSIRPPDGLANLYGEAEVELISANVSIEGGPCCSLGGIPGEPVVFPGELPCEGGDLEDVQFEIDELPLSWSLSGCEVGFTIYINSPDALEAVRLLMDLELTIDGSMYIESVTPLGDLANYTSYLSFTNTTITFDFDDPMNPIDIDDIDEVEAFVVILDGLNGSLDAANFLRAAIEVDGLGGACIPETVTDPGLGFPLESGCDYCSDIYVQVGAFSLPGNLDLDDCENGFGIYLRSPTSNDYDRIIVEFQIDNPDDLTLEISTGTCGSNLCTPSGSGGQSVGNCIYYWPSTGIVHYSYCPSVSPVSGSIIHLLDVKFTGNGCIPGTVFFETTKVLEDGAGDYCWPLLYPSTVLPLCNDCPDPEFTIAGSIRTEDNEDVYIVNDPNDQGVFMLGGGEGCIPMTGCPSITTTSCECVESTSTSDCNGEYSLTFTCRDGDQFSIIPYKDVDYLNGVTTYDLVLIRQHILNIAPLGSPYKIIAADANKSNTLTTYDLVIFRQLILQIITDLPDNTSWRFVDASYTFPTPSNPFSPLFPECIEVDLSVDNSIGARDFIAVKVGDVNNSVLPCEGFTGGGVEERGQPLPLVATASRELILGETATIEFTISSPEELVSWELGLRFDPRYLQFEEALPGDLEGMNISNFGTTQAGEGKLRALWVAPDVQPVSFREGIFSFRLKFKALQPIDNLAALLSLDDSVLQGRAYRPDGAASPFLLAFMEPSAVGTQGKLPPMKGLSVAVIPNPFTNELRLTITIPEDDWLEVSVFGADGRMVASWSGEALGPQKELVFNQTENWGTGVFTYRASTAQHSATGKIIR